MPQSLFCRFRRQVHLVDRCLLLMMLLLLLQSAAGIFLSGRAGTAVTAVDVVIRTASAAIFGYLLGGNFGLQNSAPVQAPTSAPAHILEGSAQKEAPSSEPQARIGFTADETAPSTELTVAPATLRSDTAPTGNRIQVLVATAIGLFCLMVLLVLRNLTELGVLSELSDSANATVIQFRDFVSGCVGFLIGTPARATNSNS